MSKQSDKQADAAMLKLWKEWFEFYQAHFRAPGIVLSAADQMAFYEIAQPLMRDLALPRAERSPE